MLLWILQELHEMADKLKLKRSYFQNHNYLPHYDLTPAKRELAVKYGAIVTTVYEFKKGASK